MTFDEIISSIPQKPYYRGEQSDVVVYNADCRDVLPHIPDKSIDLVLTDFPYGNETDYGAYKDTQENLKMLVGKVMPIILGKGKISLVACGIGNMFSYPVPDWVLSWYWLNTASGSSRWGFNTWQPILAYGKDPYLANNMG